MSHFTRMKTRFSNLDFLRKALDDLSARYSVGEESIRGFAGQTTRVDVKVFTNVPGYDIGFVHQDDSYLLVGDWYGLKGFDRTKFLLQLAQRYAYHAAVDTMAQNGFQVAAREVEEDGAIRLVLRRTA